MDLLKVFLLSMVPVIELRGAIPVGAALDVDPWLGILMSVLGNLLPIPFLVVFGGKVLHYFASFEKFGKPFRKILQIGEKKVSKMNGVLFVGLMTFVAIPLPGTGAWTGALISIVLGLRLRRAMPPIIVGVLIAATIVSIITYGIAAMF